MGWKENDGVGRSGKYVVHLINCILLLSLLSVCGLGTVTVHLWLRLLFLFLCDEFRIRI